MRKGLYLGLWAKNQKNKGTLLSQTFKVEESNVALFFDLWLLGRDMAILSFKYCCWYPKLGEPWKFSGKVPESQLSIYFVPVPYILRKCQAKLNLFKRKIHRKQNVTGNLGHPWGQNAVL